MATTSNKATPEIVTQLGKRIKHFRVKNGYSSQETFAYDNGYSLSQYSQMERGLDIRFTSLVRVCNAFGITLRTFFSEGFDDLPKGK